MSHDSVLYSKNVVLPEGVKPATIFIKDGRISSIERNTRSEVGELTVIDYGDTYIMPGLIDCHVHINEPGRTTWEGFETATQAAAAGGITTLVDMPLNSSPVTVTTQSFQEKLHAAQGKLSVNCGFWGGIVPGYSEEVLPLIKAGVMGFKTFLCHSGIDDFPDTSLKELELSLPVLADHGLPLLVHAEMETKHNGQLELEKNANSYMAWLHSRPASWENEAIRSLIALCRKYKVRIHIVHLSSAAALDMIRSAKSEGLPLTVETCPHYLFFAAEEIPDKDTRYKCAPPIRERENNRLLWEAVKDQTIDFIVSDHSPAPPQLKELESGDLKRAWGGIASLQFTLPAICTVALKDHQPAGLLAEWMSTRVADFLGLRSKGRIEAGNDADLVIWNPNERMKVDSSMIRFRHKVTPYEGALLNGVIEETWVGGDKIYKRNEIDIQRKGRIILSNK
ncbi:MAG: hypothetical protein RLZZ630_1321 [Bacteroidota bacterium]